MNMDDGEEVVTTHTEAKANSGNHQQSAPYRMVALDLDGTLLQWDHQISNETVSYLRELDAKGFPIALATGRAISTVYEHIWKLDFPHPLPVVCSNGSRGLLCSLPKKSTEEVEETTTMIEGKGSGRVPFVELFSTPVPFETTQKTIQLAQKLGHVTQYYVGDKIFANPTNEDQTKLTEKYKNLTGSKTINVRDDFEEAMKEGLPSKLLVLCHHEDQENLMESFRHHFDTSTATLVLGSMGWFIEILHPKVCKGNGLLTMCQHLQIPVDRVIAFGDGDNDLEFIQVSGRGIVMKNGRDLVKNVADEVIEFTNEENGVMKTLQRMETEGKLDLKRTNIIWSHWNSLVDARSAAG